MKAGCLAIYEKEKAEGPELPAIVQLLRDHIEREEERLRVKHEERYRQTREEERVARERRLLSGADCNWTQLQKLPHWYCRMNGRTYRLSPTKDKMWNLYRVNSVKDDEEGSYIGRYQRRGNATKVVTEMAYQPEPKWLAAGLTVGVPASRAPSKTIALRLSWRIAPATLYRWIVRGRGGIGRRNGLEPTLSARRETDDVELPKFGETFHMAIPSQARKREGVETRRAAPKAATPR